ncbi:DUF3572 domain-containing protein [Sedimentimonas flavescens]|uniref:DUF3572 domain-containing protein n=1 Tax=Sedimentimonas flavescens TaxID=2851012 RepID=A0ABT2ZWE9_9RHOB|nr:DUF3572 domain-containing protein [Sedimentimonas flavescens]MBW0159066.1 DUF3572 domain-containing protein [Sedimentimonas flavescens]MCT2540046.1 DUF3572 domain-containing protein [Sedimentimonas flavescens]MCV2878074.1 DUF3572 domain-containing protein [Sedimentimonas flavescens]WBL33831.1 DUF3572 domain-containing protein [Sinirhodobacter sp. HNIBRBA609]
MQHESAQVLAIRALGWLAGQDEIFDAFLAASGAAASDVRAMASDPGFLCAMLDFLMQSDAWVITCAGDLGVPPEVLQGARAVLGGGDQRHWT